MSMATKNLPVNVVSLNRCHRKVQERTQMSSTLSFYPGSTVEPSGSLENKWNEMHISSTLDYSPPPMTSC